MSQHTHTHMRAEQYPDLRRQIRARLVSAASVPPCKLQVHTHPRNQQCCRSGGCHAPSIAVCANTSSARNMPTALHNASRLVLIKTLSLNLRMRMSRQFRRDVAVFVGGGVGWGGGGVGGVLGSSLDRRRKVEPTSIPPAHLLAQLLLGRGSDGPQQSLGKSQSLECQPSQGLYRSSHSLPVSIPFCP
jgi:hypothetical protein